MKLQESTQRKPTCLQILKDHDPEFLRAFGELYESTFTPGALNVRTKMLIAFGINASNGSGHHCAEMAKRLEEMGVSKKEMSETLRVVATVKAMQGVVTGSQAFGVHMIFAP
jgi:alkylhydroperoxidase/carboxymuconolactone decarboxylase family protein YurZ